MANHEALLKWLSANGLEKYHADFLENDIDTIELALSLTSEELKEPGVSMGDRKRFQALVKSAS